MHCEQREKLQQIYLDAVVLNARVGLNFADVNSKEWLEATNETRQRCLDALADLDRHKAEHGC